MLHPQQSGTACANNPAAFSAKTGAAGAAPALSFSRNVVAVAFIVKVVAVVLPANIAAPVLCCSCTVGSQRCICKLLLPADPQHSLLTGLLNLTAYDLCCQHYITRFCYCFYC